VAAIGYLTDVFADHAVEFIRREKSHPFFLYLAFNAPHVPMEATDKYLARFTHIANEQRRVYAAMVSAMDDAIGKTVSAIRAANLEGNTLIFFFTQWGPDCRRWRKWLEQRAAERLEAADVGRWNSCTVHHQLERPSGSRQN